MALDKINRPALPYTSEKLPFYNRYAALGKKPPTAEQFDSDFNALVDAFNQLIDDIKNIVTGLIPGADTVTNADKLLTTDGEGNLSWIWVNSRNMATSVVRTDHLQDGAVTTPKIGLKTVGTQQLDVHSVDTSILADLSVSNAKLQPVPLSKTSSSGNACLVGGQTGGASYAELAFQRHWDIATVGDDGRINTYSLGSLWSKQASGSCSGSKLTDVSTPLSALSTGSYYGGVVGASSPTKGGAATQGASFIYVDNIQYGVLSGGGGNNVAFRKIAQVLNNDQSNVGALDGEMLTSGSVDYKAIDPTTNPFGNVKFFDAGYYSNNDHHDFYMLKSFHAVRNDVGKYTFTLRNHVTYRSKYLLGSVTFNKPRCMHYINQGKDTEFILYTTNSFGTEIDVAFSIIIMGCE
jgi:hypothetical protein